MKSVKFSAPEKPEAASLPATHNPPVPAYYVLPGEYELIEMNNIHFSFNSAARDIQRKGRQGDIEG